MARKVFISFLGTTNYVQTIYTCGEFHSTPTRFIQQALIEMTCKDWTEQDEICIFCTDDAYNKNWKDNGHDEKFIKEDCERIGLETILKNWKNDTLNPLKPMFPEQPIKIPEGFSKKEIWDIFNIVFGQLGKEDQIYFDITHAFRSIPMLGVVLFDYARYMKQTQIESVFYGAFEKLGVAPKVREMDLKDRLAPIVDMTEIIKLQKCSEIANGLTSYGRLNFLAEELKREPELFDIGESVQTLDEALSGNIGDDIRSCSFKTVLEQGRKRVRTSSLSKPTKDILENVLLKLSDFRPNAGIDNFLAAARWSFKYKMLPQAYAFGKEYINRLAGRKLKAWNPFPRDKDVDKNYLEMLNSIFSIQDEEVENGSYRGSLLKYRNTTRRILELPWVVELRKYYVVFNEYRNATAHIKPNYSYNVLHDYFSETFEKLVKIVSEAPKVPKGPKCETLSFFLNLSNHPSTEWSDVQLAAAQVYGKIIDMPFPAINETMSEPGIETMADQYLLKILGLSDGKSCTVHIMGEMTFTFSLVNKLKAMGVTCVASTTRRDVVVLPDGSKQVRFHFCRFRKY